MPGTNIVCLIKVSVRQRTRVRARECECPDRGRGPKRKRAGDLVSVNEMSRSGDNVCTV